MSILAQENRNKTRQEKNENKGDGKDLKIREMRRFVMKRTEACPPFYTHNIILHCVLCVQAASGMRIFFWVKYFR